MKIRLTSAIAVTLFTGGLIAGENQTQSGGAGATVPHEQELFEHTSKKGNAQTHGNDGINTLSESSDEAYPVPNTGELFGSSHSISGSPDKISTGSDSQSSFNDYDSDQNGNVTRDEAQASSFLTNRFSEYDKDNDEQLSESEFSLFETTDDSSIEGRDQ